MAGTYRGSSVEFPGTTAVARGMPSERVQHGGGDLELGPVGIVLAVAELQEPSVGEDIGVGVGGGGVDADEIGRELVDPDGLLVQIPFEDAEGVPGTESSEPVGQSVVVEGGGQNGFAQECGQGVPVLIHPGLDVVETVIALRDDEEQPDGQNLSRGERALPVPRDGAMAVHGGRQVQSPEEGPEDGEVARDFHPQQTRLGGAHPAKLLPAAHSDNRPKHERTACSKPRFNCV